MVEKLKPLSVYEYVENAMCKDCCNKHILLQLAREIDLIWKRLQPRELARDIKFDV